MLEKVILNDQYGIKKQENKEFLELFENVTSNNNNLIY